MNRIKAMSATVFAAVTLVLSSGTVANAAPTSDPGTVSRIIFADYTGGVWVVQADGSGLREVNTAQAYSVSYAPDGVRYAFSSEGEVWTASTTSFAAKRLVATGDITGTVAWSPNGKWIAYAKFVGEDEDLFIIPAGGGASKRIAVRFGDDNCSASWSPDSKTIAYCGSGGIVVQRLGQKAKLVVPGMVQDVTGGPSFTPTGKLTYIAQCDVDPVCGSGAAGYVTDADGSNPTIVAPNTDCRGGDECLEGMIGAPRARGWLANYDYAESDEPDAFHETCFQGGYQKAGTVTLTPPSFCISNMTADSYDAT